MPRASSWSTRRRGESVSWESPLPSDLERLIAALEADRRSSCILSGFKYLTPDWDAPGNVHAAFTLRQRGTMKRTSMCARTCRCPQSLHGWSRCMASKSSTSTISRTPQRPAQMHPSRARPGRVCVVKAADCMPVLFAARDGKAVGAAHAGWRGLAAGVLEATVAAMRVDPQTLSCVDGAVHRARRFRGRRRSARGLPRSRCQGGRGVRAKRARPLAMRSLCAGAAAARQLSGIQAISGGGWSTFADPERFYSYRRDGKTGRMAALIWMD